MTMFDDQASRRVEAAYQTIDVQTQRRETLVDLDVRRGEHILDIGCGPGLLAADLAEAVGTNGRVAAVDTAPAMLTLTHRRATAAADRLKVAAADAVRLPFIDASFDAATVTQVYEYVPNVDQALAELYRVLRPGGRAVILDTDWDSLVWYSNNPSRMSVVIEAWLERFAHPYLPRTFARRLRAVGFEIQRSRPLVVYTPTYDPDSYCLRNAEIMAAFVIGRRGITQDQAHAWLKDLHREGHTENFFFSLNRYLFTAAKPK